jgi:hypothetical protein
MTSDDEVALDRVRTPHPNSCRGPATALANEAGVARVEPHPSVELMPTLPGPDEPRPRRPCHYRAIQSSRERSRADNHG